MINTPVIMAISLDSITDDIELVLDSTKVKSKPVDSGTGTATQEEANAVIKAILDSKKLEENKENFSKVTCSVAYLIQGGATSPKCADSKKVDYFGIELKVSDLRFACKTVGITIRKFARGIRHIIVKVAKSFGMEGNLAKAYKLENPGYDKQDLIYVSDFNTFSDDTDIPDVVKEWLLENYRSRFKSSTTRAPN